MILKKRLFFILLILILSVSFVIADPYVSCQTDLDCNLPETCEWYDEFGYACGQIQCNQGASCQSDLDCGNGQCSANPPGQCIGPIISTCFSFLDENSCLANQNQGCFWLDPYGSCDCPCQDFDNDEVCDDDDMCPDTLDQEVDSVGCSQIQFCKKQVICGVGCDYADWKWDEQQVENPYDCKTVFKFANGEHVVGCAAIKIQCTQ
jgi:hypothetical protein